MKSHSTLVFSFFTASALALTACGSQNESSAIKTEAPRSALTSYLESHHNSNNWASLTENFAGVALSADHIAHEFSKPYAANKTIAQYGDTSLEFRGSRAFDPSVSLEIAGKTARYTIKLPSLSYDLAVKYLHKKHALKAEAKGVSLSLTYTLNNEHTQYQLSQAEAIAIESLELSGEAVSGQHYADHLKSKIDASLRTTIHDQVKAYLKLESTNIIENQLAIKDAACKQAAWAWDYAYQIGDKVVHKGKAYVAINEGNSRGNPPDVSTWFWKEVYSCN